MDIQTYNCSNNQKVFVNIKSISPSISVLYFTDENKNDIHIPDYTFMYIYYNAKSILLKPYMERYFICFTDNYELIMNGKVRYLTNNRNWNLDL